VRAKRGWRGPGLVAALAAGLALGAAGTASAQDGPQPDGWDGTNPFVCELQHAGFNATGAHPEADPYCVDFDKTHQNVDQLGIVEFLSLEPARVSAASPKCFYFQSDHWRSSVVQADGLTKLYEWDGHYFLDKATGEGGGWVTNFNINGHTGDPSTSPGMPASYGRFMGPGTGGVILRNDFPADANCAARAAADPNSIYARRRVLPGAAGIPPGPAGQAVLRGSAPTFACARPTGRVTSRSLGPVALGESERRVRALLGKPVAVRRGFLHYCRRGAARYEVGLAARGGARRVVMVLTTNRAYRLRGVGRGSPAALAVRRLGGGRVLLRQGATRVVSTGAPGIVAGLLRRSQ